MDNRWHVLTLSFRTVRFLHNAISPGRWLNDTKTYP